MSNTSLSLPVIVVVCTERLKNTVLTDLRSVLGTYVEYTFIDIDLLSQQDSIEGDIVLVTHPTAGPRVRAKLKHSIPILRVNRTVFEDDIKPLLKMPVGTKILVVNDSPGMSEEMSDNLNNLNLSNVTFYPMRPDYDQLPASIAITPNERKFVPKEITTVIDIGNRHLAISTFLDIFTCLHLNNDEIMTNLIRYSSKTIDDDIGVKKQYRSVMELNTRMQRLFGHINTGVLTVSREGTILFHNKKIEEFLGQEIIDNESRFYNLFPPEIYETLSRMDSDNHFFTFRLGEKVFHADFEAETVFGELQRFYCFSDATYILFLENSMRSKAISSGFVAKRSFEDITYSSKEMKKCIELVSIFAESEKTVLIQGESGTGKELLAQSLHNASHRKAAPFVAINCAALPESLLESELFGYEKGAFTGARQNGKIGLFEQAQYGTLFLDEIGDMPISLQARLLRVLQEKEILRVGGTHVIPIDVRIVAATNQDLFEKTERDEFRKDLYYRLNVLPITVPPLRKRVEDILPLFKHFTALTDIPENICSLLLAYSWPGNVRELQNTAEYYRIMRFSSQPLPAFFYRSVSGVAQAAPDTPKAQILSLLREQGPLGREKLSEKLKISEYSLRKLLDELRAEGLITVNRGCGGISAV